MNYIWNKLLTKECVIPLIAIIVILLVTIWIVDDRNQQLRAENKRLVERQVQIDAAIIDALQGIYDAMPQPVQYVGGVR